MGWFLLGQTSRRRRGRARQPWWRRWDRGQWQRVGRVARWVAFMAVLGGGWWFGEPMLRRHLARQATAKPVVELVELPTWLSGPIEQQLLHAVAGAVDPNPFDQLALQEIAAVMGMNPWVRQVDRVQRRADGRITIHASYRQPVALFEGRDGYHLVAADGLRLPLTYGRRDAAQVGLPIVKGVRAAPPLAGRIWPGADAQAALHMARLVARQAWRGQVAAIDLRNFNGRLHADRPHLKLLTRDLSKVAWSQQPGVEWGRAPGQEQFFEPMTAVKLQHVQHVLRDSGGTLDYDGRWIVDVSQDRVWKRPAMDGRAIRYTMDQR